MAKYNIIINEGIRQYDTHIIEAQVEKALLIRKEEAVSNEGSRRHSEAIALSIIFGIFAVPSLGLEVLPVIWSLATSLPAPDSSKANALFLGSSTLMIACVVLTTLSIIKRK